MRFVWRILSQTPVLPLLIRVRLRSALRASLREPPHIRTELKLQKEVYASDRVEEALRELEDAIERRGKTDPYPFHVLGSQGLSWVRRALMGSEDKARLLSRLANMVGEGVGHHPRDRSLAQLSEDLKREYLMIAVGTDPGTAANKKDPD